MLIQTIKLMSEVKVVKRFPKQMSLRTRQSPHKRTESASAKDFQLIAIGASTGGPVALQKILSILPGNLPVPIVIVQHIATGFLEGFKDWLSVNSKLPLKIGNDGELLEPGTVYIAPDNFQFAVTSGPMIRLVKLPNENGLCPSVDYLFRSVAEVFGPRAIGVLLTGMGKDGAKELLNMKDKGAFTIVQDEASCVVYGMPGEAVKIGAATQVLSIEKIAGVLSDLCKLS
jgi:two-component system chemotaxis response regulator CheB